MLHIVDIPPDKRLNYKTDIDNCSQSYKHLKRNLELVENRQGNKQLLLQKTYSEL